MKITGFLYLLKSLQPLLCSRFFSLKWKQISSFCGSKKSGKIAKFFPVTKVQNFAIVDPIWWMIVQIFLWVARNRVILLYKSLFEEFLGSLNIKFPKPWIKNCRHWPLIYSSIFFIQGVMFQFLRKCLLGDIKSTMHEPVVQSQKIRTVGII